MMATTITTNAAIFCLAYILGLLLTSIPGDWAGMPLGAVVILLGSIAVAGLILSYGQKNRRFWRTVPRFWVWLIAGLVGLMATLYLQVRLPQPSPTDICHLIPTQAVASSTTNPRPRIDLQTEESVSCAVLRPEKSAASTKVEKLTKAGPVQVTGKVVSAPRLTRSQRLQFQLAATQVQPIQSGQNTQSPPQPVSGTVYVTVPVSAGEQIYPGLTLTVAGSLYRPKPAATPGGFDFAQYLAQQGIFTGLHGTRVLYPATTKPTPPLFWAMRQRIVQAQNFRVDGGEGALISAMVMGKSAVDVPYEIQDQFKQTGLAHALAASGAQVSLLLGVILALTRRFASRMQFGLGAVTLLSYIGLTGIEASVLRAGIMGGVTLLALTINRKVRPVGSLLLTATVLLLVNPLWIWDLGFQLSFLATLGLLVTVPIVSKWLDWLPVAFASMVAVPLAAYVWTMPLMLFAFGVISPYSILINVLVSPLIALISLGGMASAVAALLYPAAGSWLAWVLAFPARLLIKIAEVGCQLPGNTFAVGTINVLQVGLLYGLILLIWQWQRLHRYWWLAGLVGVGLVAVPVGYTAANLSQVTVLPTSDQPALVIQDKGKIGLIHSGNLKDVQFSLLPFLQQQGINQLDWAIAPSLTTDSIEAWQALIQAKPVNIFYGSPSSSSNTSNSSHNTFTSGSTKTYTELFEQVKSQQGVALPLSISHKIQAGGTRVELIDTRPDILRIQFHHQTWLWLKGVPNLKRQADLGRRLSKIDVIAWSGNPLSPQLLEKLQPKTAIVFGDLTDPTTQQWLLQHRVTLHSLPQNGAIQSTPKGFVAMQKD